MRLLDEAAYLLYSQGTRDVDCQITGAQLYRKLALTHKAFLHMSLGSLGKETPYQ